MHGDDWHALDGDAVIARLRSSAGGLAADEATQRLSQYGPNALPEARSGSVAMLVLRQFQSPLIYLLFAAAGLSFALGERTDAAVILVVVVVNAIIGAIQEGRAERSMAALRRISAVRTRVVRDGAELTVAARDLVPGDVIVLAAGDAVAADARLLEAAALRVSEASLTGESAPVSKQVAPLPVDTRAADRQNMIYSGTHVAAGRARALVVATGTSASIGEIARLTEGGGETKTPLERRIEGLGKYLLVWGLVAFALVCGLGLLRGMPFGDILIVGIGQLVSVVPEGLPVAMTIALAVGMQRMAARRTVVRRLAAVETLGSTTIICSDKTGTLTANVMTVTAVHAPAGQERALLEAMVLCNDAELGSGDPTEVALLVAAAKAGIDVAAVRAANPRLAEIPFDSTTKLMATGHAGQVIVKGAPEAVLELCAGADREGTHAVVSDMATRALRPLAAAVIHGQVDLSGGYDALRGRAELLGVIGQIDPPREEARLALATCRAAGIRAIMITGDHKGTALAIARQLDLATPPVDEAIDGRELAALSDEELAERSDRTAVFARVEPAQKLRIVEALQRRGNVVAMTGDGVNDAPALARADVGVAMGITGTEVAKQAADIVITDDNFATIVAAVEEGRVVYRNLQKAVLLLVSTGVAEVVVLALAVALGYPLPFMAVQILWNNLVTEGTVTVNLAMEPREGDEMRQPPIPRGDAILNRTRFRRLALLSAAIAVSTLGFFIVRLELGMPLDQARTATFTLLAVCEWFNVLNCRSETASALSWNLLKNRWLLGGLVLSNVLQMFVVFHPTMNRIFYTVPLPWTEVLVIGATGSLVLWVEEIRKYLVRRGARGAVGEARLTAASAS